MIISARIDQEKDYQKVTVTAQGAIRLLNIPAIVQGPYNAKDGNELLLLALATCYCNDLFGQASLRNIQVASVEVSVSGKFDGPNQPAKDIYYDAKVAANCSATALEALVRHTDKVAGANASLRSGIPVNMRAFEALPVAIAN